MNSTKKLLAFILATIMLVSVSALPVSAAPSAPSKVTATQNTTAIKLSWTKVSGATGYRIYYKLPGDISWRTGISSTTATSHTFKNLPEGQHYTFAVRSYVKSGSKVTWGGYKEIRTATQTAAPKKLTAAQNETAIKLTWSEVKGATGYRIYYRATSTKSWKVIVSATDDTTHTFKNISPAKKYDFAVRPYIKTSSAVIWSDYKTISTATKPEKPSNFKAVADYKNKTVTLSWNKVTRADGYRIYYKKTNDSTWKLLANSTTATKCTVKNVPQNYYNFAVLAFVKTTSGTITGAYNQIFVSTIITPTSATSTWTTTATRPTTTKPTTTKLTTTRPTTTRPTTTRPTTTRPTTTRPTTTKPTTTTTQHRNKFDIYHQVFKSNNFLAEINDPDCGKIVFAKSGNKMYVEALIDETLLKLVFNGDVKDTNNPNGTWYLILDSVKKYSTMSEDAIKNFNLGDNGALLKKLKQLQDLLTSIINLDNNPVFADDVADVDGQLLVCESTVDSNGNTLKYYFDGDVLVQSDTVAPDGSVSSTKFSKITTEVPDTLFQIPTGYSYINLEWIMNLIANSQTNTTSTTKPTTTSPTDLSNPVAMNVSIIEVGMDAQERFYAAIDSAGWGGSFKANSQRITIYVDGVPMDEQVILQISSSTTGDGYQYVYFNLADYGIDPSSSTISFEIPEGFLKNKTGTKYNYSCKVDF